MGWGSGCQPHCSILSPNPSTRLSPSPGEELQAHPASPSVMKPLFCPTPSLSAGLHARKGTGVWFEQQLLRGTWGWSSRCTTPRPCRQQPSAAAVQEQLPSAPSARRAGLAGEAASYCTPGSLAGTYVSGAESPYWFLNYFGKGGFPCRYRQPGGPRALAARTGPAPARGCTGASRPCRGGCGAAGSLQHEEWPLRLLW